jgi:hypothetical protein
MHYQELWVRTYYDGKDLMSVGEIFSYDEDGEEHVVTESCMDIVTCADQGTDLWSWLRSQVEGRLKGTSITYDDLYFEDEPH